MFRFLKWAGQKTPDKVLGKADPAIGQHTTQKRIETFCQDSVPAIGYFSMHGLRQPVVNTFPWTNVTPSFSGCISWLTPKALSTDTEGSWLCSNTPIYMTICEATQALQKYYFRW